MIIEFIFLKIILQLLYKQLNVKIYEVIMKKKVILFGAGPSSLAAAYNLSKNDDYEILILEKENYIGGISTTISYNGNHIDIGGHRFFTKSDRINNLWEEILPLQGKGSYDDIILNNKKDFKEGGPDPEKEDDVMLIRNRVSRIYFLKKFFDYPISLKMKTLVNMGFFRTMKCGFGYVHSCMFKRKEKSLEDFYINRFGKPLYKLFFKDYTTKLWGVSPSSLSPSWGKQRVKGLSLRKAIKSALAKTFCKNKNNKQVETSLIEQFKYPKYGPGQLYKKMADILIQRGCQIKFNSEVVKIFYDENNKITKISTSDNNEYTADYFISSMAIKDLVSYSGEHFKDDVKDIALSLPYRDFITVGLLLKKMKIKNKTKIKTLNNIIPDNWIYVQEKNIKMGRIQIFNNWSPYMVKDPLNTIWIGLEYFCNEFDSMWNQSDDDFINMAIDELIKMQIIVSKDDVIDSTRIKIKKAYPAYFGSYEHFNKVKAELDKIPNLYCVGRNGQHRYNNMDHSMLTGLIAADKIINDDANKEDLWNVNVEQEYSEEKKNGSR